MKKYTHAWLAFKAIERLEKASLEPADRTVANSLIEWFKNHRDGVIRGAWYPDTMIRDNASSHILKIAPVKKNASPYLFKSLPKEYLISDLTKTSPLLAESFTIDKKTNLPDRCESMTHSVVDHLKTRECEDKGSPVSPNDNQIALLLFMLSHYVADGHVPFHCDARQFSEGENLHGHVEDVWDETIDQCYRIDKPNERFFYNPGGYPLQNPSSVAAYESSFLKKVDDNLGLRTFSKNFGADNNNVWDFMSAICQRSFVHSYSLIPEAYDHTNVTLGNWQSLSSLPFEDSTIAVLSDAIDSISRIWFRLWQRYLKWQAERS